MAQSCEVKRIQLNSVEAARADYLACLGPQAQGQAALEGAQGSLDLASRDALSLMHMHEFLLRQLERETGSGNTMNSLEELAKQEVAKIETEIEELKSKIRTQRRRFLDASPSVSPAVAGLYYTQTPDNQVLITFLSAFGAFLLFTGVLVLLNQVPFGGLDRLTMGERVKSVVSVWIISLIVMYVGFYMFT